MGPSIQVLTILFIGYWATKAHHLRHLLLKFFKAKESRQRFLYALLYIDTYAK